MSFVGARTALFVIDAMPRSNASLSLARATRVSTGNKGGVDEAACEAVAKNVLCWHGRPPPAQADLDALARLVGERHQAIVRQVAYSEAREAARQAAVEPFKPPRPGVTLGDLLGYFAHRHIDADGRVHTFSVKDMTEAPVAAELLQRPHLGHVPLALA